MKTQALAPFLGINNRKPDFSLRVATSTMNGQYLRSADNVDVNNAGKLRRIDGATRIAAMANPHSLFADSFVVRSAVLYSITLPTYAETMLKVLTSDAAMSYVEANGSTYYSNGTDSGRVTSGVVYPLALPTPDEPTTSITTGGLLPGRYQVGVSYSNATTGEEGGISASSDIELTTTSGIHVVVPAATTGATHVNIYLSDANGSVPKLVTSVVTGTASYDCVALGTGRESNGRFEAPLPAGTLFMSNGRLCSFSQNTVFVGLPYRHGYYLPASGYIPFPADVTVAVENQGGTYIAADQTYWFPGDLGAPKELVATVLPYGAVAGTAFKLPDNSLCGWFGKKGIVFGATSGEVEAVMTENIDLTPPQSGFSTIYETTGYSRVMSCGWTVNLENKAATTYSVPFTSASGNYVTRSDGIYQIDSEAAVDASIGFGKMNFETEAKKSIPAVYLGIDASDPMMLTVTTPNSTSYEYLARSSSEDLKIQRIDPGKGLLENWFDLALTNTNGSAFTMASISFGAIASSRRI